jgi:hypothetical protein
MLNFQIVTSYLGRFTQIKDELVVIGEIVDPEFLVKTTLNSVSKPWGSFVRDVVSREVMPTWERLWDDFIKEELRCSSGSSGQQHMPKGDDDLSLWSKGKKKIKEDARQGPKGGTQPQESSDGKKKEISKVRCFACGEMWHYVGQCPKRKKKRQQGGMAATTEEEFDTQFARECVFVSDCSVDAPSNVRLGDRIEEDLPTQSIDSEGAQTQFSRIVDTIFRGD